MSQSRLNVCDNYKSQVSDPAKNVRLYKEQQLKKVSGHVDSFLKLSLLPSVLPCTHTKLTGPMSVCSFFNHLPCSCFPSQTIDQLSGIQAELQESVKELAKAKKKYYDCEQVAHAVREKADIEAK